MSKKNLVQTKKGSGLIMTIMLLAVMMITVLSLVMVTNFENRMSSRTAASSKAFQSADSAMEYALSIILRAKREAIGSGAAYPELCDKKAFGDSSSSCSSLSVTPLKKPTVDQEIYFLDASKKILGKTAKVNEVKFIKAIGKVSGTDQVGRSVMAPVPSVVGE